MDEIEKLSAEIHQVYCVEYEKRFGKPYWTNGDYSKLDEPTKNYDRNLARWHLTKLSKAQATIEECCGVIKGYIEGMKIAGEKIKSLQKAEVSRLTKALEDHDWNKIQHGQALAEEVGARIKAEAERDAALKDCKTLEETVAIWKDPAKILEGKLIEAERDAALSHAVMDAQARKLTEKNETTALAMEAMRALQSRLDAAMKVLFYCGSTLSARMPDALGKDIVIAEWQKRAHHCWERITAFDAAPKSDGGA